jgi:hypothetical protein
MPDVPRRLAEHTLEVNKTERPIKQKLHQFAKDRKQDIEVEVCKLLAAGFIRECKHPVCLANPVLVPKKTDGLRMCIDYTDLNKHCPKDPFPLPRIDQVVDSTADSVLLCFLDCYSGYHQIALNPDNKDKTTFITPHDIYFYKVMTFGLKNAGATYQKAIQKYLKLQIMRNIKAYVDDVVVKTTEEDQLIADLTETFTNPQEFQRKLNPTKCVFGVPSGLLLGFMVGYRGTEDNPHEGRRYTQHGQAILQERHHEAHRDDGGSRSFHQQVWRERFTLLQAIEEGRQVRMGRRSTKGVRSSQGILDDTTGHDTSSSRRNTPPLHLRHH